LRTRKHLAEQRIAWPEPDQAARSEAFRAAEPTAALIAAAHLVYHNTGYLQPGYNRFSLDYMIVVLAVLAPSAFSGSRRWISPLLVAWSVAYFHWIT
jgi:hypothetical protein